MDHNVYFDIEAMNKFMKPYGGTVAPKMIRDIISKNPTDKTLKKCIKDVLKNSIYGSLDHYDRNAPVNLDFASLYPKDFGIDLESLDFLDEMSEQNELNETKIEYGTGIL